MKIIVCGAGQVGGQIARHLARESANNQITVIDSNPALIRRISDDNDVNGVTGFASHPDVLELAGARDADMVIAATQSDEVNMVVCQVAHSVFEVPRKIARLRSPAYLNALYTDLYRHEHLPIDVVISPEQAVADAVMQRLAAPSAFDIESFLSGKAQLAGIALEPSCAVLNTPLRQLSELFSTLKVVVVGVRRKGHLFVPSSSDQLYADDQIYLVSSTEDLSRVMEVFGKTDIQVRRALVIGAGNIGLKVAQKLETGPEREKKKTGGVEQAGADTAFDVTRLDLEIGRVRTKVIEKDRERAEFAADVLKRTVVLNGDGLDIDLLDEANVGKCDAVIALTNDDKTNILACVRSKSEGAGFVVALVNDSSLVSLISPLGIDAYVDPRATTVSSILRYIRHGRIKSVYSIGDGEAEILEAEVLKTSEIAGKRIRDAGLPEGAIVGLIRKGAGIVVPQGDTVIEPNDVLTVFALSDAVADVEALFQVGMEYF